MGGGPFAPPWRSVPKGGDPYESKAPIVEPGVSTDSLGNSG